MEAMLMTAPPPVEHRGDLILQQQEDASRLIASALRNCCGLTSARGVGPWPPPAALLTAASSPPSRCPPNQNPSPSPPAHWTRHHHAGWALRSAH
jgi:hypothetical protein